MIKSEIICIFAKETLFMNMEKNKVIMKNGKPKVVLNEEASAVGGVSIEEAKVLAFQVAQKIMHGK